MTIGIDASNIREGGGLTHLKALLQFVKPEPLGITKIMVWASSTTLNQLPDAYFIEKVTHPFLNKSTLFTFLYQLLYLKSVAKNAKCNIIFASGGTFISAFRPFVTMSQNMLPFEWNEAKHYGWKMRVRLKILHYTQSFAFKRANGLIFLTNYAKNYITKAIQLKKASTIIPHGVNPAFRLAPRIQKDPSFYTSQKPFEFLYVSYVTVYKHQWMLAEAVCQLHQEGLPMKLKLIGRVLDSFEKVEAVLTKYPNSKACVEYIPGLPHSQLIAHYHTSDAFVFPSSCENMPIILIEAMSAGLPIASSNFGPMPEVLSNAGLYFNPHRISEIKKSLKELFENHELRTTLALQSYQKTNAYSWEHCSQDTFAFLVKTAKDFKK